MQQAGPGYAQNVTHLDIKQHILTWPRRRQVLRARLDGRHRLAPEVGLPVVVL